MSLFVIRSQGNRMRRRGISIRISIISIIIVSNSDTLRREEGIRCGEEGT